MTAKEITLNYLKSIQKDLENAITKSKELDFNPIILEMDCRMMTTAIKIVEEAEGE